MTDDTAATLQMDYDWAVHEHGPDSVQAKEAEKLAYDYFNTRYRRAAYVPNPLPATNLNRNSS